MQLLSFLGAVFGIINLIAIAIVIFILKQPDPQKGRTNVEIQELQERITELSKHLVTFEKKLEKTIQETNSENLNLLQRVNKDVGRQLKDIHDNL